MRGGRISERPLIPLLTGRGLAVLGALLVIPTLGLIADSPAQTIYHTVFLGISVITLSLIVDWFTARRMVNNLRLTATLPRRVFATTPAIMSIAYKVRRCFYPVHCTIRPVRPVNVDSNVDQQTVIIAPNSRSGTIDYNITPLRKGEFSWPGATIRLSTGLRLFQFQCGIPFAAPGILPVYPNPVLRQSDRLSIFRGLHTGMTPNDLAGGEGKEFDRLRPYSHGDELRSVDWKRSARRAGSGLASSLVVRVYRPETHQRVAIALDCSRRMGNLIDRRLQFDYACDAVSALANLAISNQDEVGLMAFSHRLERVVPARRGYRQLDLLSQALMPLEPASLEPDYDLLRSHGLSQRRRSLFVVITSVTGQDALARIGTALLPLAHKHLPLVVTISDRSLAAMVEQPAETVDDAYVVAAAVEQTESIERALQTMGRHGIEYLQADVQDLSSAINRRYWELKIRGKL